MAACDFSSSINDIPNAWRYVRGWLAQLVSALQTQLEDVDKIKLATAGSTSVDFAALWGSCEVPTGALVFVQDTPPTQWYWDGTDWIQIGGAVEGVVPVGGILEYSGSSLPSRYLWCDGKTIGNPSSSATALADANTETLFVFLWNNYPNTVAEVQNSAGTPVARGASGLADFNNNRRIKLPDHRGRVVSGNDNLGGTSANVVVNAAADTKGGSLGAETHTLILGEIPSHQHQTYSVGAGAGTIRASSVAENGVVYTDVSGASGGGGSHNNMQPTVFEGKIIRY